MLGYGYSDVENTRTCLGVVKKPLTCSWVDAFDLRGALTRGYPVVTRGYPVVTRGYPVVTSQVVVGGFGSRRLL